MVIVQYLRLLFSHHGIHFYLHDLLIDCKLLGESMVGGGWYWLRDRISDCCHSNETDLCESLHVLVDALYQDWAVCITVLCSPSSMIQWLRPVINDRRHKRVIFEAMSLPFIRRSAFKRLLIFSVNLLELVKFGEMLIYFSLIFRCCCLYFQRNLSKRFILSWKM